jgi:hypothetical protein
METMRINLPGELKQWLKAEAKRRGLSMRAFAVGLLWGSFEGSFKSPIKSPDRASGTKQGQKRDSEGWVAEDHPGRAEFVAKAREHHRAKGYRFSLEGWLGHYDSNGGRVGKNPMKSWKGSMVTFEKNRVEMEPESGKAVTPPNPAEIRRAQEARARGEGV